MSKYFVPLIMTGDGDKSDGEEHISVGDRLLKTWCLVVDGDFLRREEGATTAEYAVVLVAATSFAAVLMAILKSDTVRNLLTNIISKALSVT